MRRAFLGILGLLLVGCSPPARVFDDGEGHECSERDCTSSRDNDCNGIPDKEEESCTGCPLGITQNCTTALRGECSSGRRTCLLAEDLASVAWSDCEPVTPPGRRDCTSSLDHNCNGTPDNEEELCGSCEIGETVDCSTGLAGVCETGNAVCEFSEDNSSSVWSECQPVHQAKARDCDSSDDHNCDGVPDNEEAACTVCEVGEERDCDIPAEAGIGTCQAGSQSCLAEPGSRFWGECTGSVHPTSEGCGPIGVEDTNCDGIVGNGSGCTTDIGIWSNSTNPCKLILGNVQAAPTSPGPYWTELGRLPLFQSNLEGTSAVHNCTHTWSYQTNTFTETYVRIGGCQGSDTSDGIVGYVSNTAATGYTQLGPGVVRRSRPGGAFAEFGPVPLWSCPEECVACSDATFYLP